MNSSEEIYLWLAVLLGTLIGSFLNVVVYRLPRKESLVWPGSHCPICEKPIHPGDNLPVLSFIMLRGRCRGCGTRISWRYPIIEAANGLAYGLIVWYFGPGWEAVVYAAFFSSLLVISYIDFDHQIIPDVITLPGIGLGLLAACTVLPTGLVNSIIGLLLGGGVLLLLAWVSPYLFGKEGMGGGDIKLLAMIGAFLGWQAVILTMLIGAIVGATVGLSLMTFRILRRDQYLPFGPFLAFGAVVSMFFHEELFSWYVNFLAPPH